MQDLNQSSSDELAQLQNELQDHVRASKEHQIKSEAMQRNQQIMRKGQDELQKQVLEYSEEIRRKDTEIMKLSFTVQDLQQERNELEHKIREYDNGFISKTPQRDDPYQLDLSEFNVSSMFRSWSYFNNPLRNCEKRFWMKCFFIFLRRELLA